MAGTLSSGRPFGKCSVCSGNGRIGFQGRLKELNLAGAGGGARRKICKGAAAGRPRGVGLGPRGGGGDPKLARKPF